MGAAPFPVAGIVRGAVRRPRLRLQDHVGLALGAVLLASLLLTSFVLLDAQEDSGRRALGERFAARSVLGAAFVTHFVQDLAEREAARATRAMSSTGGHDEAMAQAVDAFGLDAAVELDAAGRLLAVWPPRPDIIGTVLSDSYAHLATAMGGSVGVSDVVPSAAEGEPVVAVAVPFETPQGRHVFSGAFAAEGTPLGSYFTSAVPMSGGRGYLLDAADRPIVNGASDGGDLPPELGPEQLAGMRDGFSEATVDGVAYAYSRAPVAGTSWHAVLVTPSEALYEPVHTGGWRSAALLAALAAASLAGFVGLVALARARVGAATSASAFGEQAVMLRSVISNNHSLISVKDLDGRYLLANEAFQQAHGITEEQLLGRTDEVVDPALASVWRANDERARSGLVQVEEWSHAADGRRTYESMKFPLHDGAGTVYATCGVSLDVTDLRHYVRAMESARDTAVAAAVASRDFAASAAHELRTPTTSILGYVEEVLEAGNLGEADREYLEVARRNARRLGVLIDDLLVVGQADVGATMMHPEPTEVAALVSDVLSMFNAVAHRGGVALVAETAPDLPPALVDPARTEQALTNLVGNALKFTPRGGEVRVTARHVATGADGGGRDGGAIEVLVADTGVGIEPAELGHIFERFYRSQSARDQSVKGTGLGLAIASSMIEAQGGRISVASTPGRGTTFTITLPVAALASAGA